MKLTLEKILQSQGFGSRKFCRSLVLDHRVRIDGCICTDPAQAIETDRLKFVVDDEPWQFHEKLYLVLNKPAGYECSHTPQHHLSVFSLFPQQFIERGLQCVGRLDQDTTGLLLLSDDGSFIHRYTSPKKQVAKVYDVTTADPFSAENALQLKNGVQLRGEKSPSRAIDCQCVDPHHIRLLIDEGKYHQVKRMVAATGNRVTKLHRSAIGAFVLPDSLSSGQWRTLTKEEIENLDDTPPV